MYRCLDVHENLSDREVSMTDQVSTPSSWWCGRSPRPRSTNEKYFGDLDAVVGDGDFGYSMARGFEIVLADWDALRPHATSARS